VNKELSNEEIKTPATNYTLTMYKTQIEIYIHTGTREQILEMTQ
jgi:hypothetical protein